MAEQNLVQNKNHINDYRGLEVLMFLFLFGDCLAVSTLYDHSIFNP
jgi:hypothetical protein